MPMGVVVVTQVNAEDDNIIHRKRRSTSCSIGTWNWPNGKKDLQAKLKQLYVALLIPLKF